MIYKKDENKKAKVPSKGITQLYSLVLHNDEINCFDYIIETLMDICDHSFEQAVQCTIITHHKGQCGIRNGKFEKLNQLKKELNRKKLKTSINIQP